MILLKNEIRKAQILNYQNQLNDFFKQFQKEYSDRFKELLSDLQECVTVEQIQQSLALNQLLPDIKYQIRETVVAFANENLNELVEVAFDTILRDLDKRLPNVDFSKVSMEELQESVINNFNDRMTSQQVKALEETIHLFNSSGQMSFLNPQDVSEVIKEGSSLNSVLLKASLNYFKNQIENDASVFEAKKRTKKAIDKKVDYRAQVLTVDQVLDSYRKAEREIVGQSVKSGMIPFMLKRWMSAGDHRVCPICQELNKQVVDYDKPFVLSDGREFDTEGGAHALCRCAMEYFEKETYNMGIVR